MKKIILFLLIMILSLQLVSSATIVGTAKIDVDSNYDGFSGLTLLATISTTPATTDSLHLYGSNLPSEYKSVNSNLDIPITFPKGKYEQTFGISNTKPLYSGGTLIDKTYLYISAFSLEDMQKKCDEKLVEDIQNNFNGRVLMPGVDVIGTFGLFNCHVQYILIDELIGHAGKVYPKGNYYKQDINIKNIGTLTLEKTSTSNQPVDHIPNVAKATMISFADWTNAGLVSDGVYAYEYRNEEWHPFFDYSGLTSYEQHFETVIRKMDASLEKAYREADEASLFNFLFVSKHLRTYSEKVVINDALLAMSNEAKRLKSSSYTKPNIWDSVGDLNNIRYSGNTIIVPVDRTTKVATIQLLLNGERVGLEVPTGEPEIISVSSNIIVDELTGGYLDYTVRNSGNSIGTFTIYTICDNRVNTNQDEFSLIAGQTRTGRIYHTAKSTVFSDKEHLSCTFVIKEINTKVEKTQQYGITIDVRDKCAEGEESNPMDKGTFFMVEIYTATCQVKDSKTCAKGDTEFKKINNIWTCVQDGRPKVEHCSDEIDNDGDGKIDCADSDCKCGDDKPSVFLPSLIIAIILGIAGLLFLKSKEINLLHHKRKFGILSYILVFVAIFLISLFVVAFILKFLVGVYISMTTFW